MKVNSIKFKICVLYVAALGLVLAIYRGALYYNLYHTLYKDSDSRLKAKAGEIGNMINEYVKLLGNDKRAFLLAARKVVRSDRIRIDKVDPARLENMEHARLQKVSELGLEEDYIQLLTPEGRSIVTSNNMDKELRLLFTKDIKPEAVSESFARRSLTGRNLSLRILTMRSQQPADNPYIIQIGTSYVPIAHILRKRLFKTAMSIPIIMAVIALVSYYIVARILRPVYEITNAAKDISYKNLGSRVNVDNIDYEMKYLASAFNEMIARLQQSFRYIDEFNSHVAHELKTPLAIIKGESEVALRKERSAEEYRKALSINLEEAERMSRIINDLLLLARLDYKSEILNFQKVSLNDMLWEIAQQSRILSAPKNIVLTHHAPGDAIYINASPLHLRRAFINLIDNAVKFTPAEGRIEISAIKDDRIVGVSVSDTGIGMSEEETQKIFNRFFRADNEASNSESGQGLGLYIAKSIVQLHGGDISVESRPGCGSTFNVTLPLT